MKIKFESKGKFCLYSAEGGFGPTLPTIEDVKEEAEYIYNLTSYRDEFQIIDMYTGEVVATLEYEEPSFSGSAVLISLKILFDEQCKNLPVLYPDRERERYIGFVSMVRLMEEATKLFSEKVETDFIEEMWNKYTEIMKEKEA